MKIAVYLVGQWRGTSYDCSKYLKQLFEDFDTDYYIYTWDSYDGKDIWELTQNKKGCFNDSDSYTHSNDEIEKIRNSYPNVVSMQVGSTKSMNLISQHCESTELSSFPQFYQTNNANKYRKIYENTNGFQYDAIIKLRPDILFKEEDMIHFIDRIKYIKQNPKSVFSHYHMIKENLIPNVNLVWDYYTISSPFGMDCMMEWVDDVINNDDINRSFSSNYIIKHELIPNPEITTKLMQHNMHPVPTIMRELFKYNNLVDIFYKSKHSITTPPSIKTPPFIDFLYDYLYRESSEHREKYDGWFDWIDLGKLDYTLLPVGGAAPVKSITEAGLCKLANLIIENYKSDEDKYRTINQ